MKNEKNLNDAMDKFLNKKPSVPGVSPELAENQEMDCSSGVCIIKNDKSIVERMNKKIITEDGRQLLI
jgi:hypothetical protein